MIGRRVAVMVDGDNISAKHAARILAEAKKQGRVDLARAYAANPATDWLATPGFRVMLSGVGKNAADLLLCIDAMEAALATGIEVFVLASSDRDYTHLAQRLREYGRHVLGLGEKKAPTVFRAACTEFVPMKHAVCKPSAGTCASEATDFDNKVRSMIAQHSRNGHGMLISHLAPKMFVAHGTRISSLPERKWRGYLAARPNLYEIDPRGPEAMVRYIPAGFLDK